MFSFGLFAHCGVSTSRQRAIVPSVTCASDHFPDSPGGGGEHGGLVQAHATHVHHVEAVHVLGRGHGVADGALVDVICRENKDELH